MQGSGMLERMDGLTTSQAVEDYAKVIYGIGERDGAPVSTSRIAEKMNVSPASVSAMVKRLGEMGLLTHVPYRGVELTERGTRVALEVLRHHRLLETFLAETLDMPWDQVHAEAEVLEHVLSEELEDLIAAKLGHPDFDPHGDPIPTRDGRVGGGNTRALSDLNPGEAATFVRVSDSDSEMLRYLADSGIAPGQRVSVVERQPFDGPLFIDINGERHVVGLRLAASMRVVK